VTFLISIVSSKKTGKRLRAAHLTLHDKSRYRGSLVIDRVTCPAKGWSVEKAPDWAWKEFFELVQVAVEAIKKDRLRFPSIRRRIDGKLVKNPLMVSVDGFEMSLWMLAEDNLVVSIQGAADLFSAVAIVQQMRQVA
jgi:hypothetical protein